MFLKIIYFAIFAYFVSGENIIINSIKEELSSYNSNLVDENVLKFLQLCYTTTCCKENDQVLCPSYFELVRQLKLNNINIKNTTNQELKEIGKNFIQLKSVATKTTSSSTAEESATRNLTKKIGEFCKKFQSHIPKSSIYYNNKSKHSQDEIIKIFNEFDSCKLLCMDLYWEIEASKPIYHIKPICNYISWMAEKLSSPPLLPTIKAVVTNVSVNNQNSAPIISKKTNIVSNKEATKMSNAIESTKPNKEEANIGEGTLKIQTNPIPKENEIPLRFKIVGNKINKNDNLAEIEKSTKSNEKQSSKLEKQLDHTNLERLNINTNTQKQEQQINQHNGQKSNPIVESDKIEQQKVQENSKTTNVEEKVNNKQQTLNTDVDKQQEEKDQEEIRYPYGIPDENDDDGKSNDYNDDDDSINVDGTTNKNLKSKLNNINTPLQIIKDKLRNTEPHDTITRKHSEQIDDDRTVNYHLKKQLSTDPFYEESGSNFFTYFLIAMFLCIISYVLYYNKSKVLGILIEGRRSQKGKNRRKRLSGGYRKLDTNLEEAITSASSGQTTQIIY